MNEQFELAIRIFSDIYGTPKWEDNPKEGQSIDAITQMWCSELKNYTLDQVREACYWLVRKRKTMTFPTISHLMAELVGQERTEKSETPDQLYKNLLAGKFDCAQTDDEKRRICRAAVYKITGFCVDGYIPPAPKNELSADEIEQENQKYDEMEKFLTQRGFKGMSDLIARGGINKYRQVMSDFREYYAKWGINGQTAC